MAQKKSFLYKLRKSAVSFLKRELKQSGYRKRRNLTKTVLPDRLIFGFPPRIEDFFGELTNINETEWNYQLWLEEWAEPYLGTIQFQSLTARFSSIPQVKKVLHDDRVIFLIESSMNPNDLKNQLWEKFLEAAAAAHGKSD